MESFNQWDEPQRQSPAAVFILLWSTAIKMIKRFWPLLAVYFFKGEKSADSPMLLWFFIGFSLLTLGGTVITYWFKKYYIRKDTLIIQSGWLKKKTLSIPIHTIQAVHLEQNVWQQAFNVAKITFDTVGSEDLDAQLDAITMAKAEQLKQLLAKEKYASTEEDESRQTPHSATYSLSFSDLMKLSLTSNHLEAFFILFALLFNVMDELRQILGGSDYFDTYGRQLLGQTGLLISAVVLAVTLLSMVFSIVRTLIRYYGFRLIETDQRWVISHGLFDKTNNILPLNKIQVVSWSANWLRRKIDYWTIEVQSVGQKEGGKTNLKIPVVSYSTVIQLARSYQDFSGIDEERSFKIESAYWKRRVGRHAVLLTLVPLVISYFWLGWQSLVFLMIFPYLIWNYYQWYRNFRWQTTRTGIQLMSGVFGRKFTLLNWVKIQQIHLHQNFYQRKRRLATLVFITAGGKVSLPYIQLSNAILLVDQVLYEVESMDGSWM